MNCASCKSKFSSLEQVLSCDGHQFHPYSSSVTAYVLKDLGQMPGLSWRCDDCTVILKVNLENIIEKGHLN